MLEKLIKKKTLKLLIYIFGALIEVIGFSLLFAFDKTMLLIHSIKIPFALFFILTGYLFAIGVRKK